MLWSIGYTWDTTRHDHDSYDEDGPCVLAICLSKFIDCAYESLLVFYILEKRKNLPWYIQLKTCMYPVML